MDKEFNDGEQFTLNIEKCIADKSMPAVIRETFVHLRDHGYINVGKFFKEMSDLDLDTLQMLAEFTHPDVDATEEQTQQGYEYMTLLGLAMLVGEGHELTEQACENSLRVMISYVTIETLARKNLVEAFHENWSMDMDDTKPIVKAK